MRTIGTSRFPQAAASAAVVLSILIATLSVSGTVVQAHADPGFCGVRYNTAPGLNMNQVYVVKNKCNQSLRVRVYFADVWPSRPARL